MYDVMSEQKYKRDVEFCGNSLDNAIFCVGPFLESAEMRTFLAEHSAWGVPRIAENIDYLDRSLRRRGCCSCQCRLSV